VDDQPSKSGLIASGVLHAALLAAILVGFAEAPKFDDGAETMPVDTVTQSQFNEIMKGEHNGKPVKTPVDKPPPKPIEATAPVPPAEPAKVDPPVLKHIDDPGEDATPTRPPKPTAETPPPPPPPPQREAAAPPPAPPPDDAEIDRPKPKVEPKAPPTPPAPPNRPKVVEKPPEKPKDPVPDKAKADNVAKFLEKMKAEDEQKPPSKPKSGDAPVDPPRQAYDPNAIAKLIGQAKPAPNKQVASLTPLGSPTQNAPRMSPSLSASLDGWLQDAYLSCWTQPPTMPEGVKYVAQVRVSFNPDGSLSAQPQLVNPPSDPAWRAYAESSMRAVLKCNPLRVPPQYVPYFQQWKVKTVHFDPENAQG
jgi:colicin import membrane protein